MYVYCFLSRKPCVEGTSACVINYQSSPLPSGDRLKPPPSGINFEKKLIKLKSDLKTYTNEVKESGDATSSPSKADVESQQNRVGHANAYSRGVKHNISSLNQVNLFGIFIFFLVLSEIYFP